MCNWIFSNQNQAHELSIYINFSYHMIFQYNNQRQMAYQSSSPIEIPNISEKKSLQQYINTIYPSGQTYFEYQQLSKQYSDFRSIRADGNCFYRAIAFLYLAKANLQQFRNCFKEVPLVCRNLPIQLQQSQWIDQLFEIWEIYLRPLASTKNRQQDLAQLFSDYIKFDIIMIAYFRSLNYQYLEENKYLFEDYNNRGIIQQLQKISTFNSQGQQIEVISLAKALRIKIIVAFANRNNTVENIKYNEQSQDDGYYLFFRPGQYDIVYPDNLSKLQYFNWNFMSKIEPIDNINLNQNNINPPELSSKIIEQNKPIKSLFSSFKKDPKIEPNETNSKLKSVDNESNNKSFSKKQKNTNIKQKKAVDPRINKIGKPVESKLTKTTLSKNTVEKQDFKYMESTTRNSVPQKKIKIQSNLKSTSSSIRTPTQCFKIKDQLGSQYSCVRFSMQAIVLLSILAIGYLIISR